MIQRLKTRLIEKLKGTVFYDAISGNVMFYQRNKVLFLILSIVVLIFSFIATGVILLSLENLGGEDYPFSLYNIIGICINKGLIFFLIVYAFCQLMTFKYIKIFLTSKEHDSDRNYDVSKHGTYGTGGIMTRQEMLATFNVDVLEKNLHTIYGKDPANTKKVVTQKHPLLKINRNTFMVAGPSAGKSATFVIPMILQMMRRGESAIISDPKSELFKYLSELGKKLGYEVRILNLNPMFLSNSDPCNFMMYVGEDVDKAQVMSSAIISNTTGGSKLLDFWNEGALNLLQAIILRINCGKDYEPEEKNLPEVFNYLIDNSLDEMEADFEMLNDNHPAKAPFKIFKDGEEKVKKQVVQGLSIKLKLFNSPLLKKILSKTEGNMDILNPGRKKCLYFIGSNDQDASMAPIVSMFYTLLYQELVRYADSRLDGALPVAVHMVLDEYANMGTIPDFEKKLSTVRSRNIITYIIVQDINQLKTKHPHDTWKTVLNDCDYFLLLKTNDQDTMKWWSEMSGKQTTVVTNKRMVNDKTKVLQFKKIEETSEGQGQRDTFTTDEIRRLKEDEVLVMVSQRKMIKLKTFFYKEHPYARHIKEVLPAQHYPFWRLIEDGIVDKDFDYDKEPSYIIELEKDEKMDIDPNYNPDKILKAFDKNPQDVIEIKVNTVKTTKTEAKNPTIDKMESCKSTREKDCKKPTLADNFNNFEESSNYEELKTANKKEQTEKIQQIKNVTKPEKNEFNVNRNLFFEDLDILNEAEEL